MKLRVARHTTDLNAILHFYNEILGLEVLGKFEGHNGYNGVFLGLKGAAWHLEFTISADVPKHRPDDDDLLVFYQSSLAECELLKKNFEENGISPVVAKNPYWNANGTTYLDPDGYGVVITVAGIY
jgi:catechol 2,3-dioxygenase-like lactoylglutathione lyase family enzyme